jgi:hypothetical protein
MLSEPHVAGADELADALQGVTPGSRIQPWVLFHNTLHFR